MTDNDYSRLDEILMDNIENCLSLDEAHGFLSAMLVSQFALSSEECVESICGDSDFENNIRKEVSSLILNMYTDIQTMLNTHQVFDILFIETEEEGELVEVYEGWCHGFMLAVCQEPKLWDSLAKNEQSILSPIAKLALLISDETLEIEDDEYDMLIELLPGAVMGLYSYFENKLKK
ncbi:MAG: YecA family protein [Thiohalomonadales bacterium]